MASNGGKGFFDEWPKWAAPMLALAAMIFIGGLWVGLPVLSALKSIDAQASGVVDYTPMMSVFIAMTTVTITGIFLFMTLRIDRGTRLKAERVAKETMEQVVAKKMDEIAADEKKEMDKIVAEERKKIRELTQQMQTTMTRFVDRGEETLEDTGNKLLERFEAETKPDAIRKIIDSRITEEKLREHVDAILMVTANGEIVNPNVALSTPIYRARAAR